MIEARLVEDCAAKLLFLTKNRFPVLHQRTVLLALVNIQDWSTITPDQRKVLIPRGRMAEYPCVPPLPLPARGWFAVPVTLGAPTAAQREIFPDDGTGLWLLTEGATAIGLSSTSVILPECVSQRQARSLNHALTILSQVYEPWRSSHTGSVYRQVFYQEDDRQWRPLSLIRDNQLASASETIARELWQQVVGQMRQR